MGQLLKNVEPTIWALRKNSKAEENAIPSLYEHLYGYDPIRVMPVNKISDKKEAIRKGSAENPNLNILNPGTNFMVRELASEDKNP